MLSFVDKLFALAYVWIELSANLDDERRKPLRHIRRQSIAIWARATDADLAAYATYRAKQSGRTFKSELREAKYNRANHRRNLKNKRIW